MLDNTNNNIKQIKTSPRETYGDIYSNEYQDNIFSFDNKSYKPNIYDSRIISLKEIQRDFSAEPELSFNSNNEVIYNDTSSNNDIIYSKPIRSYIRNTREGLNSISIDISDKSSLSLNKILNQDKDISTYEKMENFKNWFMNNFMEILQTSAK